MARSQDTAGIALKHLESLEDLRAAVVLQKEIWGFDDIELLPLRLFVVARKVGGQIIGAYDGAALVGFLISIPGLHGRRIYLHSHMMGVRAGYRDQGIGRRLKLAQRDEALGRGITLVEWTFDPLELKNAYFNIERLGAVARRYVVDQYGTTSSPLHGGLPTDRCVAEWLLDTPRVHATLERRRPAPADIADRVAVASNIDALRRADIARARAIQLAVRQRFQDNFRAGLEVSAFERTAGVGVYVFTPVRETAR